MTSTHTAAGAGRYGDHGSSLRDLPRLRDHRRMRVSSWDTSGGNDDRLTVQPGETVTLADIRGAGSVNHIWVTVLPLRPGGPDTADHDFLRKLVLRIYWDDAAEPSVLVPVGDFFGVGHARTVNFTSAPLQMSPEDGRGFNSFFHMPFASRARFELTSECTAEAMAFYYYIDYDAFGELEPGLGRFHASWNRENPTDGVEQSAMTNPEFLFGGQNVDGAGNYTILDTVGRGHYVGCVLSVTNLRQTTDWNWYGEGDDMIFVDGEPWPPRLHGTGTEDYFNTAWFARRRLVLRALSRHPLLPGGENSGPARSRCLPLPRRGPVRPSPSSIRVTIEHGHANHRSDDCPRSPTGTPRSPPAA